MARTTICAAFALVCACSGSGVGAGSGARPDPGALDDPAGSAAAPAVETVYGGACTPDPENFQGSCPEGALCAPVPNGYCSGLCGNGIACGPGGVCAESPRGGEFCLAECQSDSDCRTAEGWICDPNWRACTHRKYFAMAPIAPRCEPATRTAHRKSSFGPARQITTPAGGSISDQEVHAAVDATGAVTAAYIAQAPLMRPNGIGLTTVTAAGVVSGDRTLADPRRNHYDPWMARDRAGQIYVVWLGLDRVGFGTENNMQIGLSSSADGRSWTPTVAAHDPADCPGNKAGCLDKPMIAIGPDVGNLRRDAIYVAYAGERGNVVVRSTDGGRTFAPGVVASEHSYGDLFVDARGHVHLVNATATPRGPDNFGGHDTYVEYVRSTDGGASFSASARVSAKGHSVPGLFVNPQVAADPGRRRIYVAYATGNSDMQWNIALAVSTDDGASWRHVAVNDPGGCGNHMLPALALDTATGDAHVMWVDNADGVGQVGYARCTPAGCSEPERISEAPFASYGFVRHSTRWLGEYNALIIDPDRRVLHAVWAQPVLERVGDAEVARARIFHARSQLP